MTAHPLASAFSKIHRARHHIDELRASTRSFLQGEPYSLTSKLNRKKTEEVWSLSIDPIPWEIECQAADALHNLRTPLDKMLAADFPNSAIHTRKAERSAIKFPAANSANQFEKVIGRIQDHLQASVVEYLRSLQPYPGGVGEAFYLINHLDNQDKHRSLLEPMRASLTSVQQKQLIVQNGRVLRVGSRHGRHMLGFPGGLIQPNPELRPVYMPSYAEAKPGALEYTSRPNDFELLTTDPGAHVYPEFKPKLYLSFAHMEALETKSAAELLEEWAQAVEDVLNNFGVVCGLAPD